MTCPICSGSCPGDHCRNLLDDEREILARCDNASLGPWRYEDDDEGSSMGWVEKPRPYPGRPGEYLPSVAVFDVCGDSAQAYHDAEFSAHARADVPELLRRLAHERARVAWAEGTGPLPPPLEEK